MSINRRKFIQNSCALVATSALLKQKALAKAMEESGIASAFKDDFKIGTALSSRPFLDGNQEYFDLVKREFNAITMENAMKWERIHPKLDEYDWRVADGFVEFGKKYNMYTVGHVLVWHSQVPPHVFQDEKGKTISRDGLIKRMRKHIETVAGRYAGKIDAWDVVNEAIADGKKDWRDSPWTQIIGPEFLEHAFNIAHEVDPKAQLLYNDYNMQSSKRRDFAVPMIQDLKKRGVPIQGIGMQAHYAPDTAIEDIEKSIVAYSREGMRVHITELDIDVLPQAWEHMNANISDLHEYSDELNPWPNGLPAEKEQELTDYYVALFKLFLQYRDEIDRVTLWGISDAASWKNNFPVIGRTNYPLLFNREWQPKPAYHAVMDLKK
jgi:endo-1,4-beta-xylanase